MRASLPMYDLAAVRTATDAWWAALAGHMRSAGVVDVPDRLTRPAPAWATTDLLFSQTCGYPLTHALSGRVEPLLTPIHAAPGCSGPNYASALVVSAERMAAGLAGLYGTVCAINSRDSHSGCNVLRRMIAPLARDEGFFERVVETGSHARSIERVAGGDADLCAVDAVTHALMVRHTPEALEGTRILMYSPRAPGLPWVAGPSVSIDQRERMCAALRAALRDPELADTRAALLIEDAAALPVSDYACITDMENEARALGYPELR